MGERPCCNRLLMDTGYLGENFAHHERIGQHDWLDNGQFCCLNWPARWKQQTCWCNATRWVHLDTPSVVVGPRLDPEYVKIMQATADAIAEESRRTSALGV